MMSEVLDRLDAAGDWVPARNAMAWAVGEERGGRFFVRRIVWGRLLAREEKRPGETIRAARVLLKRD
jgi:hypothetical protein